MMLTESRRNPKPAEAWSALSTKWEGRTKLAAQWLQAERAVADIGCGLMALETYLPSSVIYMPVDVVPRDARTLVIDLNKEPLPNIDCTAAVLLGVLEYTTDVGMILLQLRKFPKSLISYNHLSINDLLWALRLRKKKVSWTNRHSRFHFLRLIAMSGLHITQERSVRLGERLYEVRPNGPA